MICRLARARYTDGQLRRLFFGHSPTPRAENRMSNFNGYSSQPVEDDSYVDKAVSSVFKSVIVLDEEETGKFTHGEYRCGTANRHFSRRFGAADYESSFSGSTIFPGFM